MPVHRCESERQPPQPGHRPPGGACGGLVQSNNTNDAQLKGTFPGWVSATPSAPADFALDAGSYAREAGAKVPVFSDFFLHDRPALRPPDLGAVQGQ